MIDCDPQLNDAKELIIELNKSNGMLKFVRTMREKFLEAVARGMLCVFPVSVYFSFENKINHGNILIVVQDIQK